jgi:hypothetical protein
VETGETDYGTAVSSVFMQNNHQNQQKIYIIEWKQVGLQKLIWLTGSLSLGAAVDASTMFCPHINTKDPVSWSNIFSTFSTNSLRFDLGTALDNHWELSGK